MLLEYLFVYLISCIIFLDDFLSPEFSSLMSNTLTSSGLERLFGIAFVFTVETGFIPISLAEHYDSIHSNSELAKIINSRPLNSFWHQNKYIFTSQLVMSNQLCDLTGFPHGNSIIITLSHSNVSKCILLEMQDSLFNLLNGKSINLSHLFYNFKNEVSVPIKCCVLEITIGQYPNLCGIPEEIILYILKKLDSPDLYALMRCNKKLKNFIVDNQILWKLLVIKELKKSDGTNQMEPPITDWRNYYYELKRTKSGRRRIIIERLLVLE